MGRINSILVLSILLVIAACTDQVTERQQGEASYYADSLHGNKTASGEPYDKNALTAAHLTLPFGTRVKVTYPETGQSVEVTINDRGPYAKDRIIDLSAAAADRLGLRDDGHGEVTLEIYGQ